MSDSSPKLVSRRTIERLLAALAILPVLLLLLSGATHLLAGMGDHTGAMWLLRLSVLVGIFWLLDLIVLVALLALDRIWNDQSP